MATFTVILSHSPIQKLRMPCSERRTLEYHYGTRKDSLYCQYIKINIHVCNSLNNNLAYPFCMKSNNLYEKTIHNLVNNILAL